MKYLNFILTIIAFCLVIISLKELHLFPEAKAEGKRNFVNGPTNPDGSINVKIIGHSDITPVNLVQISDQNFFSEGGINNKYLPAIPTRPGK